MDFFRGIYTKIFNETKDDSPLEEPRRKKSINNYTEIIAFGNILLDMTIEIENFNILDKYGLIMDGQGEISNEILNEISNEARKKGSKCIIRSCHAGGSALNTVRILKELNRNNVKFYGAIGEDKNGEIIKDIFKENSIDVSFQIIPSEPTGQCLCFVKDEKCSLYANIGASKYFTKEFLITLQNQFLDNNENYRQIFYVESFFIPGRYEVCEWIIKEYLNNEKLLAINLNGSYIIKENFEMVKLLLKHSTLIFGNKSQYVTLIEELGYENVEDFVRNFFDNSSKKIVIITDGNKDVEMHSNYETDKMIINYIPVQKISSEFIVDTTGAGDSFVAGFLDLFLKNKTLEECVLNGCKIAGKVITQIGCNLP